MELADKIVAVTGCNKGIGHAFVNAVAAKGVHLILINRSADQNLEGGLQKLGAKSVVTMVCDLSDLEQVSKLRIALADKKIDILFNNAGLLTGGLLEEQKIEDIHKMLQVNVQTLISLTHAVLPQMLKSRSGKIINHGSVSSIMHLPCASTYSAAKAAVWAFTDCLEQELKNTGVSTLCLITPGIRTRMFAQIDEMYSKNVEVPKDAISPEQYALKIIDAIESDAPVLWPSGTTGIGVTMATHLRPVFNFLARTKFRR